MMGIKIYALLKMYGVQLFTDYITGTYNMARVFADIIKEAEDFELALEPAANIVCFRYVPPAADLRDINDINIKIRERLKEDGEFYIVRTIINNTVYLRTTLMNPFTTRKELIRLLQKIRDNFYGQAVVTKK